MLLCTKVGMPAVSVESAAIQRDSFGRYQPILAGIVGNVMEWYDFTAYGYFASVIGRNFFPSTSPLGSLIAAFGVFAAVRLRNDLVAPIGAYRGFNSFRHQRRCDPCFDRTRADLRRCLGSRWLKADRNSCHCERGVVCMAVVLVDAPSQCVNGSAWSVRIGGLNSCLCRPCLGIHGRGVSDTHPLQCTFVRLQRVAFHLRRHSTDGGSVYYPTHER